MQSFNRVKLSNGITLIHRQNDNTPRTSINIFINGGNCLEPKVGASDLMARLFLKGTKKLSAEDIAIETDKNAIDFDVDAKQDYTRVKATFLNGDIDKALDIISDVLLNSTFELFDKEINILKGELEAELDSPRAKTMDRLLREMYPDHPYGVVSSKILECLPTLSKEDIINNHSSILSSSNMLIVVVGACTIDQISKKLENAFSSLSSKATEDAVLPALQIDENKLITITKEDAFQAQIFRAWHAPVIKREEYPAFVILNNVLGSAGLSSRLFIELRDKKGLAYNVRSTFDLFKFDSNFSVYIGTDPSNIKKALKGFDEEIQKLIESDITKEELESAKRNVLGKRAVFHETNSQQCFYLGLYEMMGVGADFDTRINELINQVSVSDVRKVAQQYLANNHITTILAPSKFIKEIE